MDKNKITIEKLKKVFENNMFSLCNKDDKDFNLNIIGVRSNDLTPNVFNDLICIAWVYKGIWNLKIYEATTDPGLYWLQNPMNVKGAAIMVPGQYHGCYVVGLHKDYKALRQVKPMKYYRDYNRDNKLDFNQVTIVEEIGLTNIHRANEVKTSTIVDKWSAGCQVIANPIEFDEFMTLCQKAKETWGNSFSYTLITEKDLDNA